MLHAVASRDRFRRSGSHNREQRGTRRNDQSKFLHCSSSKEKIQNINAPYNAGTA
jgi:hypothetical protein